MMNVAQVVSSAARMWPKNVAVVDVGAPGALRRELTYRELFVMVLGVQEHLMRIGVTPGSRVALTGENSVEFVACWYGILATGAAVVPMQVVSTAGEMRFRIEDASCVAVITDAARREIVQEAVDGLRPRPFLISDLEAVGGEPTRLLDPMPVPVSSEAPAFIMYTSGTTGVPKGAVITHSSVLTHGLALSRHHLAFTPKDRVLGVLPMTLSYGSRLALLSPMISGATVVLMPRFDAACVIDVLRKERITFFPGVPTMFSKLVAAGVKARAFRHLRWALSAGAPLPEQAAKEAEAALGCYLYQGFGLTESHIMSISSPPDRRVLNSVGRPAWGVNIRAVDDGGNEVPAGCNGEVLVSGPNVMLGYLHQTESPFVGGWFRTGDVGHFDDDGRLFIVGRKKEMLIVGGNNVYPTEVESLVLDKLPEIVEVAVVGKPDEMFGEVPIMFVVLRAGATLTEAKILKQLQLHLSGFKVPKAVVITDALPVAASGKVLKRELTARALQVVLPPRS